MFGFITDAVENVLDIGCSILDGEDVTKNQVAKLISDGVSIAVIASAAGVAVEVIEHIMED